MTGGNAADAALGADGQPLSIDVRRGAPTAEELAALLAVVSEAYQAEAAAAQAPEPRTRDGWSLSQRGLRAPLPRQAGWARSGWTSGA
ncbi:acyl-CoA carboxylase subunit epsilon [Microbacterium sp. CJ88]|uniref:acyl-CoA carboxylase subunit epsilon n=1 Tax=Microbacterium sp. CJ88 TaxID=3445672 RepID=UPI003F658F8D